MKYFMKFIIEWKKNRVWGLNPHCKMSVILPDLNDSYTYKVSGCGYDKLSSSMTGCINKAIENSEWLMNRIKKSNAYGVYKDDIPRVDYGIGIEGVRNILTSCGFELTHSASGEMFDYFYFEFKTEA